MYFSGHVFLLCSVPSPTFQWLYTPHLYFSPTHSLWVPLGLQAPCPSECAFYLIPHHLCIFLVQVSLWLSTESPRKQKNASQTSRLPRSPFQTSLTHKFGGHMSNSGVHIQTISGASKLGSCHLCLLCMVGRARSPPTFLCSFSQAQETSMFRFTNRQSSTNIAKALMRETKAVTPPPPRPWFGSKILPTIKGSLVTRGSRNRCEF